MSFVDRFERYSERQRNVLDRLAVIIVQKKQNLDCLEKELAIGRQVVEKLRQQVHDIVDVKPPEQAAEINNSKVEKSITLIPQAISTFCQI